MCSVAAHQWPFEKPVFTTSELGKSYMHGTMNGVAVKDCMGGVRRSKCSIFPNKSRTD